MARFEVNLYYSSFCTREVEAENEEEAILKARNLDLDTTQILANLESWNDLDEAIK